MRPPPECDDCALNSPPRGIGLDRLAEYFEAAGAGSAIRSMVPLQRVLEPDALAALPPALIAFYADPTRFEIRAGLFANRFSHAVLRLMAYVSRQALPARHGAGLREFGVCQWLYADGRGRVHWDRYACLRGHCERLFVARMGFARGRISETFVVYGVPVALQFRARVDGAQLCLESAKTLQNPLSWLSQVTYRTESEGSGLITRGDFRMPLLGFRVRTEFRMAQR